MIHDSTGKLLGCMLIAALLITLVIVALFPTPQMILTLLGICITLILRQMQKAK
jgi:hypothetical protein